MSGDFLKKKKIKNVHEMFWEKIEKFIKILEKIPN